MDRWTDGRTDRRMDRWTDGRTNGQTKWYILLTEIADSDHWLRLLTEFTEWDYTDYLLSLLNFLLILLRFRRLLNLTKITEITKITEWYHWNYWMKLFRLLAEFTEITDWDCLEFQDYKKMWPSDRHSDRLSDWLTVPDLDWPALLNRQK